MSSAQATACISELAAHTTDPPSVAIGKACGFSQISLRSLPHEQPPQNGVAREQHW